MSEVCGDNGFELIGEFKGKLVEGTNIETSPEEMAVLDNILYRFWQMGWLDKLKTREPRVMTLSGVRNLKESTPVWLEDVDKKDVIGALFMQDYSGTKCVDFAIVRDWEFERVVANYMDYGVRWRCWTSRPDEKRRVETPWE